MSGQTLVRGDIPLPGGAEAVYNSSGLAYYRHGDLLGSARLSSNGSAMTPVATAYAPYGEEETANGTAYRSFTAKKQDIDSTTSGGQFDFPACEYPPRQSRWWTPDPAGLASVNPEDPATWNRYAYGCDPLAVTDPSGMATTCTVQVQVNNNAGPNAGAQAGNILSRINQVLASTPAFGADITQVAQGAGGIALNLNDFNTNGADPPGVLGEAPLNGNYMNIYTLGIQSYTAGWAKWLGAAANWATVAGTVGAHELVHAVAGINDLNFFVGAVPNIMSVDSVPAALGPAVFQDYAGGASSGFAKLTEHEADQLYLTCIKLATLRKRQGGASVLGGFGGVFLENDYNCNGGECTYSGWHLEQFYPIGYNPIVN